MRECENRTVTLLILIELMEIAVHFFVMRKSGHPIFALHAIMHGECATGLEDEHEAR